MVTFEPNCPKFRILEGGSIFGGIEMSAIFVYEHRITSFLFCIVSNDHKEVTIRGDGGGGGGGIAAIVRV